MAAKFEISKDHAGKYRFHLKAPNGEIIAASQGYETKANAEKALRRLRRTRPVPWWRTTPDSAFQRPVNSFRSSSSSSTRQLDGSPPCTRIDQRITASDRSDSTKSY